MTRFAPVEETMLRIGDFSRVSRVPVKTLRYYDEIGLFRPRAVDDTTGYRLYAMDQLPALNRILALKDLGFSLDQIAQMQTGETSPALIRAMLNVKRDEIAERVRAESARLARVEARLRQIEREDIVSMYEVIVKQIEPMQIAAIREVVPTAGEMSARCGAMVAEIQTTARQHGWKESGPWLRTYHNEGYTEQDIDIEMALPVSVSDGDTAPQTMNRVVLRTLPGITAATTVHHAPYDTLTYLFAWAGANAYLITGPPREMYLSGPVAPGDPVTEVQFPVEK